MSMSYQGLSTLAALAAVVFFAGDGVSDAVTPEPVELKAGLQVNELQLFEDGTAFYDREVIDGPHQYYGVATMFNLEGEVHCEGEWLHDYLPSQQQATNRTVDWVIFGDCGKVEVGMAYVIDYASTDPAIADERWPTKGVAYVLAGTAPLVSEMQTTEGPE